MRLFSLVFGTSEIAVAIVLASYMAGLAVGAAIAAHWVRRIQKPVVVFGLLEGAIALAAVSIPLLVRMSGPLYTQLVGDQPMPPDAMAFGQPLFYCVAAFLVLLAPTTMMGATLPLLAQFAVTSTRNLGNRVALLYSTNTLGAVAGTIAAGFYFLPTLGLQRTVWIGAMVNLAVFGTAMWAARSANTVRTITAKPVIEIGRGTVGTAQILPLATLSGALSFVYEVLWTRMMSLLVGSSIYAFSTMLAAFLAGIALGAACAGPVASNPRRATFLFAFCQFGVAVTSAVTYLCLQAAVPLASDNFGFGFAIILPSTLFIGATFPLAVRAFAGHADDAGHASAMVYSWNTVGAIVGALAGSFYLVPALGFAGAASFAIIGNLLIGIAALIVAARSGAWGSPIYWPIVVGILASVVITVLFKPERPTELIMRQKFGGSHSAFVRELYYAVGRSSTVYIAENSARFDLSTNGLPEAQIEFAGAPPRMLDERWLGLWPSLVRSDIDSMLVVGLGGGVMLESIPEEVKTVHIVELEQQVVAANEMMRRRRDIDPLADPRMTVIVNDARNALALTNRRYDAIVSQPSHPWTSGASHLFTREFLALAKRKLHDSGVFVLWMNAEFLDETLFRRLSATLVAEFRHVRLYQPSPLALHFVASDEPFDTELTVDWPDRPMTKWPGHFARQGIGASADIVARLLVDEAGLVELAGNAPPITDDDNRMAVDSLYLANGLSIDTLTDLTANYDPLLRRESELRQALSDHELVYIAWQLASNGQVLRTDKLADTVSSSSTRHLIRAIVLRFEGLSAESEHELRLIPTSARIFDIASFVGVVDKLSSMATGTMSIDSLPAVELNDSRLGALLAAWTLLSQGDWQGIRELDDQLAECTAIDLWLPYAVQLRAEWRLRLADDTGEFKRTALDLIERVIATHPSLDGYVQRARAGNLLGDAAIVTESAAYAIHTVRSRIAYLEDRDELMTEVESKSILRQLDILTNELSSAIGSDEFGRHEIVSTELALLTNAVKH